MNKKLAIILLWIVCGIHNWGATLGNFSGTFPNEPHRRFYGISLGLAIIGPAGTIISILATNIYEYGFVWK